MSRLDLIKTYSLDGLADGFDESTYLTFQPLSNDYSNEIMDKLKHLRKDDEEGAVAIFLEAAKHSFQGGRVVVGGQTVDAEVDDLDALGKIVLTDIFTTINQSKFVAPNA
ncbi:hypothetical protein E3O44_12680 [Cryobacterium algoricola]|uniref:Uncharacterized protein n=1 Tax=Cryobacterium algoricola TaxID=1259183 RepID=A0ABY2IAU5_9MICO|nr:hypothetical protein [Cryobacterium algoricola]TFB85851.1 hypothetical protein E3O44_12680 [Cryobacterium algoricola]